ncbi:MAG: sensor domain-containing diguanylate cyclase [Proteobacteria bacterium]|nr:sensor domain-containing diguanylate cyclase [Pseudomonadota bacterium]MBU0968821.1 sensor domain-containing diguanylate cyclase [Pseudomonadota bacterium]
MILSVIDHMENLIVWLGIGLVAVVVLLLAIWRFKKKKTVTKRRVAAPSPPPSGQNDLQFSPRPQSLPSGDNVHLQLEILRQTLDLTTAILLWAGPGDKNLQILSVASLRDDIVHEPFPRGSGIIGGLRPGCPEIAVSPVPPHLSIPYYAADSKTGSLLALSITIAAGPESDEQIGLPATAILCLDRENESPWTQQEREVVDLTCRKLSHDLRFTHKMEETNRNMEAIHQICMGMLELNQVLGLQAVFEATIKTVKQLTSADFIAISLLEGEEHRIVIASGPKSSHFNDLSFPADDGLVGQAIKLRRWMPTHANFQEDIPVFSNSMRIAGLESLLILPLLKGEQEAIGALTVAGRKPDMFPKERREILEVIACQVATKIELGRAHEKIYQLATTDGLTGLANHRTFQHAFDNMLQRALRQSIPLTMVLCDLDYFKKINDTYGHPFGDAVLQEVAVVLAGTVRQVDLAARYGGEEFALLLENSNITGARKQVERVRRAISALEFHHSGNIIKISMSFGLASFPQDAENKNDLIKKADQALYHAKARGRNRSVCWCDTQQTD